MILALQPHREAYLFCNALDFVRTLTVSGVVRGHAELGDAKQAGLANDDKSLTRSDL